MLKLAKAMHSLGEPVSELPHRCTKIVMDMNHAIERFDISSKDQRSFLSLSQTLDKKLLEVERIISEFDMLEHKGSTIAAGVAAINVPALDHDGLSLRTEVIEASAILSDTLEKLREKLDDVEKQLEEIREEARSETR